MQMNPQVGDRVRVMPSGDVGHITRVVRASDGRPTFEIEFESVTANGGRGGSGESGGLYVLEDIEPAE